MIIPPSFFQRNTITVAQELLGQKLYRKLHDNVCVAGVICETEAYLGIDDAACHSFNSRKTKRNSSMWLNGGHSYVYLIYGIYHCFNVVTQSSQLPEAVLIRAIFPTDNVHIIQNNRPDVTNPKQLCNGPGKLCMALQIDKQLDALTLTPENNIWLQFYDSKYNKSDILTTPRIGMSHTAKEWALKPLRFLLPIAS